MLSTAIILPLETEMLPIDSLRKIAGVEWDGIFYPGKKSHSKFDRALIYSSPEIIPLICDLLIVADPLFCTFEYLAFAIRSGCHLFLSDKLNLTSDERKQLVQLAGEGGTYIRIQNDFLLHPFHQEIQISSNQSAFIEVTHIVAGKDEGIYKLLTDNLYMILRAAGSQVHNMDVFCGILPSNEPDLINVHLNFKNGSLATLKLKFTESETVHYLTIHTAGETNVYDFVHHKTNHLPNVGLISEKAEIELNPLIEQISDFVRDIDRKSNQGFNLNDEMTVFQLVEKVRQKIEFQINYKILA